ncbi:MAG: ImmA/IrrE family metallo-endopeptidase [Planctomycetota bacterium]|jgi:hypothetical protein
MSEGRRRQVTKAGVCDEHGVPLYSAEDIENKADSFLALFDEERLDKPGPTALAAIAERLIEDFNIAIDLEADLGGTAGTRHKVVGKFIFKPRTILVDRWLRRGTPRFNFTFAHEIGHLVLHRNLKLKKCNPGEISDTLRDMRTGKKILRTPRDWIEWQANRFAAGLLMPRASFRTAIVKKQQEMGIKRRIGQIYVDSPSHMRDYLLMVDYLRSTYEVSRSAIDNRLSNLNLLIDRRERNTSHISELLRSD